MELHLVQKEHQVLRTLYQSSVPQEELAQRQIQHSEYKQRDVNVTDSRQQNIPKRISLPENFTFPNANIGQGIEAELSNTIPPAPSGGKAPLQQQLMQHRLLQQKRQILQKQGAFQQANLEPSHTAAGLGMILSRRQMLRQASYKLAQQTQIVPPLPVPCETEFPPIAEDCTNGTSQSRQLQQPLLEDTFQTLLDPNSEWKSLPSSLASCQISEPGQQWSIASSGDASLLVSSPWQPPLYTSTPPVPAYHQVFHK
jgi:serine/threonine-protein kinase SIK2